MAVKVAPSAGFCMGVKRAVDLVLDLTRFKTEEKIYTYGPLIHNPQTVELLKRRGIVSINDYEELEKLPPGSLLVIRAHGISPEERQGLKKRGLKIVDATCPRVGRVQAIIKKHAHQGYLVVIVGNKTHPEIAGLMGHAGGKGIVISNIGELSKIPPGQRLCVVSQTTQNHAEYEKITEEIKKRYPEAVIFDTICDSTHERQREVAQLAQEMDATIIVGGKNSANTRHLATIAAGAGKPTYHVETADEIPWDNIKQAENIGISAGASTPNWIIERVIDEIMERKTLQKGLKGGLFRLWVWAVKTELYAACGAGILSLVASSLQGIKPSLNHFLLSTFFVFSMHTLNRLIDHRDSTIIGSFREGLYQEYKHFLLILSLLSMAAALFLSSTGGLLPLTLTTLLLASGLLYSIPLFPKGRKFRRLKDIPGSKNLATPLAWGLVAALIPALNENAITPATFVAFFFVSGLSFLRFVISDLQDLQSDKFIGKETLPVLLGPRVTLKIVNLVAFVLVVLPVVAFQMAWTSGLALFLILPVFYLWICSYLYDRKRYYAGLTKEGLLETAYYLAGLGQGIWIWWIHIKGKF